MQSIGKILCSMLFAGTFVLSGNAAEKVLLANHFHPGVAHRWSVASSWAGKLSQGSHSLILTPEKYGSRTFGRAFVICRGVLTGKKLTYTLKAKGEGKFKPGYIVYTKTENGKMALDYVSGESRILTDQWQNVTMTIDLSRTAPALLGLFVELECAGKLEFTSVRLTKNPECTIQPSGKMIAVQGEETVPALSFQLPKPDTEAVVLFPQPAGKPRILTLRSNAQGKVVIPAGTVQPAEREAVLSCQGAVASIGIARYGTADYEKIDSAAKKIRFPKKNFRILLIGDSILDPDFRANLVCGAGTQLEYWCNRFQKGQLLLDNRAVAGDFIERVEARLNDSSKASRRERYKGIFEKPADMIFILLGHNDTRAWSTDHFATAETTPEKQEASYRRVLALFRKKMPHARIVLVSNTASNYPFLKERAEKRVRAQEKQTAELQKKIAAAKKSGNSAELKKLEKQLAQYRVHFYGIPQHMDAFNAVLQKLAAELHLEYCDVRTEMNALPNCAELTLPGDGVHLSPAGQNYLARKLLEYLAKCDFAQK